jgi:hypothetical protein
MSQSRIQSLSPAYFPFTAIAPSLLEALWPCLDHLILYRPVGSVAPKGLQRWLDQGFLEIRVPFEDIVDKKAIMAALQQWRTWGLLHPHADTAYLKAAGGNIGSPDPPIPKLVSEIKAGVTEADSVPKNGGLAMQLFLHLAQDFDEMSWDLADHVVRFKLQEQALQEFFRIDQSEEGEFPSPAGPFTDSQEDLGGIMTANRMTAWNRLFQEDHDPSTLLFTDSPAAHAWLLETVQERVEVMELSVSCGESRANNLSWKAPLHDLFRELILSPWSEQLRQRVEEERRRLEMMSEPGHRSASVHWSLVPNESPCTLLKKRCGLKTGGDRPGCPQNTLVGLFEKRA